MVAAPCWAGISVGSGGSISLGQGSIDLGGGDLAVSGQFDVAGGSVFGIGNVLINGTLDGGSGPLEVLGDWINNGTFNASTGSVQMLDDTGSIAQLGGASTFNVLSMTSSAGGAFVLESGQVQRVLSSLTIQGSGSPVQIRSSNPPQVAELVLERGGSQNISNVGVSDVHATGEHLAPQQTNQGGTGNAFGWFGIGILAVPTLSMGGLVLLILAFFGVAFLRRGGA